MPQFSRRGRRGLILPVVLAVAVLLALVVTGFLYFLRAEVAGLDAAADAQQARLACESGLQEFLATLRVAQHDLAAWYDVPLRFRHALVWSPAFDRASDPLRDVRSRREYLEDTPNPPPAASLGNSRYNSTARASNISRSGSSISCSRS